MIEENASDARNRDGLAGKRVLVTGGTKGVGAAAHRNLASRVHEEAR